MIRRFSVLIMLFLFTLSSYGQTVGEQFYVFRSNGQVNGFIPNEVNSIEFSNVDIDGNSYDEIVTQIIRTIDSVYTIPLAEIDSISFVKPKTEYQPDVVNISDQLMSYVVSCDSLTITFSNSTPSSLLPKVGTKLVSMEMNDKFPYGFAGEVIEVNNLNSGYSVGCTLASLEDIFVTYYNTVSAYGYYKDENALSRQSFKSRASNVPYGNWYNNPTDWGINQDMHLNKETINFGYELDMHRRRNDDIKGDLKTEFSLGVIPNIHVVSTMIIRRGEGFYFMASISGNVIIEEQLSFSGGIDWQHDIPFGQIAVPIPQCPIIQFYFQPGLFFNANANLSANAKWTQEFTFGSAFELSSRGNEAITPSVNGHMVSSDFDIEGSLDGKFGVGLYMETGFNVMSRDIINACIRGEIGAEFVGNFILNNNDIAQAEQNTETYNRLKESYFEVNAFTNALSEHRTGRWGRVNSINPWNINYNIKTWDLVPTFSNVSLEQQKNSLTSAEASIDISGDCLFPVEIGMSLRTENGEEVDRIFANTRFTNGNKQYNHTFDNLYSSDNYVLYPIVNFLGNEILANPSSAVEMKDYPVSYFDKDGYTYNGQTYSYKYNCSVSVEITDNTDVEEWGFVYEDPEGKSSKVSSKSYYSPYVSELIVYRNEEKSTVRLREFVKYIDDDELYYGDYKDYEVSYNDKEKTQIPVSIIL